MERFSTMTVFARCVSTLETATRTRKTEAVRGVNGEADAGCYRRRQNEAVNDMLALEDHRLAVDELSQLGIGHYGDGKGDADDETLEALIAISLKPGVTGIPSKRKPHKTRQRKTSSAQISC